MLTHNLMTILMTNGAILIVPGLNFALVAYNTANISFRSGLLCALGITAAITVHAIAAILGAVTLFNSNPAYFDIIKTSGGVVLCFISISIFISLFKTTSEKKLVFISSLPFLQGFLADLLNPIVLIFYVSLFAQIVTNDIQKEELGLYILFIILITFSWFALVARLFSMELIQRVSKSYITKVKLVAALLLAYYGLSMIFL